VRKSRLDSRAWAIAKVPARTPKPETRNMNLETRN
jgi:hypothetical protein